MPSSLVPTVAPQHQSACPVTAEERGTGFGREVIPSAKLLFGRASVTIDHEGTLYVLRATRAGKLILTK